MRVWELIWVTEYTWNMIEEVDKVANGREMHIREEVYDDPSDHRGCRRASRRIVLIIRVIVFFFIVVLK